MLWHSGRMSNGVRVGDLMRSPALQFRLLAGGDGLGRTVSWAHVSELEDPTPWLMGAELIMTIGVAVPRTAARQRAYLERLDDAGVAGLAVSEGLFVPPLHRRFLAAADERGFPVLEVPLPVPFVTVTQEVAAALAGDANQRLGAQLRVFGALRWMASEDLGPQETFARLEELSGYRLYACTPGRHPLVRGLGVPPDDAVARLPESPSAPPSVPGGFVLPIPAPGGPAGWLVALERGGPRPAGLAVVQHIATVAALTLTVQRQVAETDRRQRAETLAELLRGGLDRQAARQRLLRHGLPDEPVVLAAVRRADGGRLADESLWRALDDVGVRALVLGQGGGHFVLAPAADSLAAALRTAESSQSGLSAPAAPGEPLDVARREAHWAVERAAAAGRAVVTYGEGAGAGRWLPEDPAALRGLVRQVLGAALDHDAGRTGSSLVETVQVWLDRDRSATAAAAALHVHPNTLAYRLRRFGELTGRDLSATADLAEVWLALAALRTVRAGS